MAPERCPCSSRRKESVLTLDGGGIRGYASLLILRHILQLCCEIEHEYDKDIPDGPHPGQGVDTKLPLPCHYFDYMFGTSTGGIIAIMLGRLRMTIDDCISVYKEFGAEIFGNKRRFWRLRYNKYKAEQVESFMKRIVKEHCHDIAKEQSPLLRDPTVLGPEAGEQQQQQWQCYVPCRVGVLALRKADNETLYMFRSYHNPTQPSLRRDLCRHLNLTNQFTPQIWEAARATSAAPTYFSPISLDGGKFMDGGLAANNPTNWAWDEVETMHRNNPSGSCVGEQGSIRQLVSLGTGMGAERQININSDRIRRGITIVKKSLNSMTNTEGVHSEMERLTRALDQVYFRFNLKGLEGMKLDEFRVIDTYPVTLTKMDEAVAAYIAQSDVKTQLGTVAKRLVEHRRERIKPGSWHKYRGLTQPGPLHKIYHERVNWDDKDRVSYDHTTQHGPPNGFHHEMPNGSHTSMAFGMANGHAVSPRQLSNGHIHPSLAIPRLRTDHLASGNGNEPPATPVLNTIHSPHEIYASPSRPRIDSTTMESPSPSSSPRPLQGSATFPPTVR